MLVKISKRYAMDVNEFICVCEDELPEMTDAEYEIWYLNSFIDVIRTGFKICEVE